MLVSWRVTVQSTNPVLTSMFFLSLKSRCFPPYRPGPLPVCQPCEVRKNMQPERNFGKLHDPAGEIQMFFCELTVNVGKNQF